MGNGCHHRAPLQEATRPARARLLRSCAANCVRRSMVIPPVEPWRARLTKRGLPHEPTNWRIPSGMEQSRALTFSTAHERGMHGKANRNGSFSGSAQPTWGASPWSPLVARGGSIFGADKRARRVGDPVCPDRSRGSQTFGSSRKSSCPGERDNRISQSAVPSRRRAFVWVRSMGKAERIRTASSSCASPACDAGLALRPALRMPPCGAVIWASCPAITSSSWPTRVVRSAYRRSIRARPIDSNACAINRWDSSCVSRIGISSHRQFNKDPAQHKRRGKDRIGRVAFRRPRDGLVGRRSSACPTSLPAAEARAMPATPSALGGL